MKMPLIIIVLAHLAQFQKGVQGKRITLCTNFIMEIGTIVILLLLFIFVMSCIFLFWKVKESNTDVKKEEMKLEAEVTIHEMNCTRELQKALLNSNILDNDRDITDVVAFVSAVRDVGDNNARSSDDLGNAIIKAITDNNKQKERNPKWNNFGQKSSTLMNSLNEKKKQNSK